MIARTCSRLSVLALLLCLSPTAALADEPIKLDRVHQKGDKVHVKASLKVEATNQMTVGGQAVPAPGKTQTLDFEAEGEVVEVYEDGRAKKVAYTIVDAKGTDNGRPRDFVTKGQTLVATNPTGDALFTDAAGAPVDAETKGLLAMAISVSDPEASDDKMFGTDKAQAVGSSWPINTEALKQDLHREGVDISKAEITGESTLVAAAGPQVKTVVNIKGIAPGLGQLPPGAKLDVAELRITRDAAYAADRSVPVTNDTGSLTMGLKMSMDANGQPMEMIISVTGSSKVDRTKK